MKVITQKLEEKEINRLRTLIEIYDRELEKNHLHSRFFPCWKCKSLFKQRNDMIIKLKENKK